jgi:hypothetical protein
MRRGPVPFATITSDPEIPPEWLRSLVGALEGVHEDGVVDTGGLGRDLDSAWLLPTL